MTDPFGRHRLVMNLARNRQREADRETLRQFMVNREQYVANMLEPFDPGPITFALAADPDTRH